MAGVTVEQLKGVCAELNKKLGLDPEIKVTSDSKKDDLEAAIKEAVKLVEKGDKLSKATMEVLTELNCVPKALAEKPKPDKKEKAEKKGPGVIETIAQLVIEKGPITKDKILKELSKKFPDRDPEAMMKTINVQLPNRMNKERGMCIALTEEGYVNKKK